MVNDTSVLIAEDEHIVAKDIAAVLSSLGYNILGTSATGEDIVLKAQQRKPDIIIMDIMLAGEMSGIEAAEVINQTENIPIIYLTALSDEETLQKAKHTNPFGYLIKPFDEKMLHSAIEMALYKHTISRKLKEKTIELEQEKTVTDKLLNNILPEEIVREFKEKGAIAPQEYDNVTLLFTDFEGFTSISSQMPPEELVSELNDIFRSFDYIIEKRGLEKLKTIGDSYMAAGGLPKRRADHAVAVVSAAFEMCKFLMDRNRTSIYKWKMRIGIHSGRVVAGVIGRRKFTYEVWGPTVTIANKMERYSMPGKINISASTYDLVKDYFECKPNVVGKDNGEFIGRMYFIEKPKEHSIPGNVL
jgi:adenylate cyclase